ncbi:reverse transcriptase [Caerostris extrusa]|uniref:Reverse transcriptase n=1 Tax=Caerostris extrusa TaxID=172846 RepID=A0AAV4M3C6_CAEEX|nr:reverse transcriptase [Caerostris extrusa]
MKRKDTHKPVHKDEPTAATLITNSSAGKNNCVFCDRSHPSQECQKISNMNYDDDRKEQIMRKRCYLVCLKPGHMAKKCHSHVRCLICERRHYVLLCPDLRKGNSSLPKSKVDDEEAKSTENLLTNLSSEYEIYLKTIIVRLRHKGKEACVRALMEDGSHRSYIEKSLVAELNLSPSGTEVLSQGLFDGGISLMSMADFQLRSVTKRLVKENIHEVYDDVLRQWQKEGIIETIPVNEISKPGHYLPRRPVIKSPSLTTKNKFLHPLLRFRTNAIGVIADIKQAFLQLSVRPEDRNFLRFLWWNTEDRSKLEFFRHCRVVFGVTSSPFLLNASIRHHLDSTEYQIESLQATVKKLKRRILYGNFIKATLHIFTDASSHGYACCAFLRCEDEGEVKVSLNSAKARVAPVQRPTIPRLELLGAAIGAKLLRQY